VCVCVSCDSSKDEELLGTYKSVYSKLLRAEKNGPLRDRILLYVELLQQLASSPSSSTAAAAGGASSEDARPC